MGTAPPSLYLSIPWLYLVFAPVFTLWDGVSMLSMSRLQGFLIGLAVLYLVGRAARVLRRRNGSGRQPSWPRELGVLAFSVVLLVAFVVTGALWHRPMLTLAGKASGEFAVDFHSHTNASHDVENTLMRGFDAEANRRWHARAGFDAVFITDHNVIERSRMIDGGKEPVICPGMEVSAWRAHIVLLGDTMPVDRRRYNSSYGALLDLLRTSDSAYGSLSLASLPEYQRNHWGRLGELVQAGLDGFEIVNAAPQANELRDAQRDSVIALARSQNRFVAGVSDSHGWGSTSMVWSLVRLPTGEPRGGVCAAVLRRLGAGFSAVRVIERHRLRPDDWWPMWLTPVGLIWETWRSMGWTLTISWTLWIWVLFGLISLKSHRWKANAPHAISGNRFRRPRPGGHQ